MNLLIEDFGIFLKSVTALLGGAIYNKNNWILWSTL